jgi:hypothetical protein
MPYTSDPEKGCGLLLVALAVLCAILALIVVARLLNA